LNVKIIDCAQNSPEWYAARLGIPTASSFDKIITPAKGDLSKSARAYAAYLVAETIMGEPLEPERGDPYWIGWGKQHEAAAAEHYARVTKTEIETVGFVTTNDGKVGCSPDRLIIGQRGAVEIKCPAPWTLTSYWSDGIGAEYRCQLQGQMAVAELEFVDLYAWHPVLTPIKIRTYRDEPYILKMGVALAEFLAMRDQMLAKVQAAGLTAREPNAVPATFGAIKAAA
jgi:hypothetical protein